MTGSPGKNTTILDQNNDTSTTNRAHARAPASALSDVGLHEEITGIRLDDLPSDSNSGIATFPIDKLAAHIDNVPHVAISIFVFHEHKLLLQKRAQSKYHSGGLWANTVCSHPRWQETAADCAKRRLKEELGWSTELIDGDSIEYHARVGELYENEYVHCFYGKLPSEIDSKQKSDYLTELFNPIEVAELKWMSLSDIESALLSTPEHFSAWFRIYMSIHRSKLQRMMEAASTLA